MAVFDKLKRFNVFFAKNANGLRASHEDRQDRQVVWKVCQDRQVSGKPATAYSKASTPFPGRALRYLILDELDSYPQSVEGEGDPVQLARARTVGFKGRKKIFLTSTPTFKGASRIESAYLATDQRKFFCPCPTCAEYQTLEWSGVDWEGRPPAQAYYKCRHNGCVIEEKDRMAMVAKGEWRATAEGDGKTAGFHISALYSPLESLGNLAEEFVAICRDRKSLQEFSNLKWGLPFEDIESAPLLPETLEARAEDWGDLLPEGVVLITAACDVQKDRIEVEICAWGVGEESWSLRYEILAGDPTLPEVWRTLGALLGQKFRHSKDVPDMAISAVCVDAGYHTDHVMKFCSERFTKNVWAVKGRAGAGVRPWPRIPPKVKYGRLAPMFMIGLDALKQTLMNRLRLEDLSGSGVCHFPTDCDADYYDGLTCERAIKRFSRGVGRVEWIKNPGQRNELWDCRIYNMAALHGLYARDVKLEVLVERVRNAPTRKPEPLGGTPARTGTR